MLIAKCQKSETECDDIRTMYKDMEKQLDSVRRQLLALEARSQTFESDRFMLKSDHAVMLKTREEELLADMKAQIVRGHADVEAVESAVVGLRTELTRAECDRQHFATSLAQ